MAAARPEKSGTSWVVYAGILMVVSGAADVVHGLWAIDRADTRSGDLLYADKLGGWGWFFLIVGIVLVLVGIGIFYRSQWARWTGVVVATIAIVGNVLWIFAYPAPALTVIVLNVLALYGLVVYGEPVYD